MKKKSKIRKEYKILIIAAFMTGLMVPVMLIFVLFPLYNLVGADFNSGAVSADRKFDSLMNLFTIFKVLIAVFISIAVISGAAGVRKDIKSKSEKKTNK